jgi:hypothetical protein
MRNKGKLEMNMTNIDSWFTEDTKNPECFANKKRLHNPPNREAALAYAMHEIVRRLFAMSIVADKRPDLFKFELEMLKIAISSYEQMSNE